MKILSFNLWHGLSPTSLLAFEALEPATRRQLRQRLQIEVLQKIAPDICFFQEVNPVVDRAYEFERQLGLDGVYQLDLVGLKLFGLGIPANLNSGLFIGVAKKWGVKRLEGISLSRPGLNLARRLASWQLKEERFAVLAETLLPKWGRVLLVNTHIHHGLEITPEFNQKLEDLVEEFSLAPDVVSELKERLNHANQKREQEISVLLNVLEDYQKRYEVILMAGDFNSTASSQVAQMIKSFGFRDSWSVARPQDDGFTFDYVRNEANHRLQTRFPLSLVLEDLTFSSKTKDALLNLARQQENRPRRIDYVWLRDGGSLRVKAAELVGLPDRDGMAPSDHFGVLVNIEA